jgi:hypothetical protein
MHIRDAIDKCDEIVEFIDEHIDDISSNGVQFYEDVRFTTVDMQETLMRMKSNGKTVATPKQEKALRNWEEGVRNWVHH